MCVFLYIIYKEIQPSVSCGLGENNQQRFGVMKLSYRYHHPEVDYFPLTVHPEVFYSNYSILIWDQLPFVMLSGNQYV